MSIRTRTMHYAVAGLLLAALSASAGAAFMNPTNYVGAEYQADPDDTTILAGQDILGAYHQYDSQTGLHYFRIDLEAGPIIAGDLNNFAGVYGIAIDTIAGGGDGGDTTYAPDGVTGIDYLIDAHYFDSLGSIMSLERHYHDYNGAGYDTFDISSVGGSYQQVTSTGDTSGSSVDRNVLEWMIPDSVIGSPGSSAFNWWGYSLDSGSETDMYDITPEPSVAILLLGGATALIRRRRK